MSRNKKIIDVELWAIFEMLDTAAKVTQNMTNSLVTIFSYSQVALRVIEYPFSQKKNRFLRSFIHKKIKKLESNKHYITI